MVLDIKKNKLKIEKIAQNRNLKFAVVFGSAASGLMRDSSDTDIAVLQKNHIPLDYRSFLDINSELTDALALGFRKIDLVDLATANILLRYEATQNGILLYGDETDYQNYRTFAFKDYIDSQSLRDLESLIIRKRQSALATQLNV
ncbi:MAG: nucleotidyltransferase domain-containing protein [bacterium]|nr:nucleotidyltransferase domain-containing protein [bacterium]